MAVQYRLTKLETLATSLLPPDGAALNRKGLLLSAKERQRWLDRRTAQELDAMILADGGKPLDMEQFTDIELERIKGMSDEEISQVLNGDFSHLRPDIAGNNQEG